MYGGISLIENPIETVQLKTMNKMQYNKKSTKSGLQMAYCTKHKSTRALEDKVATTNTVVHKVRTVNHTSMCTI